MFKLQTYHANDNTPETHELLARIVRELNIFELYELSDAAFALARSKERNRYGQE